AGVDADFAFVAPVGHVEREELDGGASAFGDFGLLGFDDASVEQQRYGASGFLIVVARDSHQYARLLRIVDAARGDHVFDGEVRHHLGFDRMRIELDLAAEAQVVEVGGPAGLLQVGVELERDGQLYRGRG